jgi:hypothetical protein
MYFPWVGLLEQVRLARCFVHYDDVQFGRGFYNRVQVKTPDGIRWMTVPLSGHHRGQTIDETRIDHSSNWQRRHLELLRHSHSQAPYRAEMLDIVGRVFDSKTETLAEIARASLLALVDYFDLREGREFVDSRSLGIGGSSSRRIHDIVLALRGSKYVTGHGARNYLDHPLFERSAIRVEYMDYQCLPYPQLHGQFTPYVTALDLVANCGKQGRALICSGSVGWKDFLAGQPEKMLATS